MGPEQGGKGGEEARLVRVTCCLTEFGSPSVRVAVHPFPGMELPVLRASLLCALAWERMIGITTPFEPPKIDASTSTLGTEVAVCPLAQGGGASPSHWVCDYGAAQGVQLRLSEWASDQHLGACNHSLARPFGGRGGGFLPTLGGPRAAPCHRDIILRRKAG